MRLEDRITRLEQDDKADMVCTACAATGEVFPAWCVHRLPPPFDRFVAMKIEAQQRAQLREQLREQLAN